MSPTYTKQWKVKITSATITEVMFNNLNCCCFKLSVGKTNNNATIMKLTYSEKSFNSQKLSLILEFGLIYMKELPYFPNVSIPLP